LVCCALTLSACGDTADVNPPEALEGVDGKGDSWDVRNAPYQSSFFITYFLADLPSEAATATDVWPGYHFPHQRDGVNARWAGPHTWSAAEKDDLVYNSWQPPVGFEALMPLDGTRCPAEYNRDYYLGLGPLADYSSRHTGTITRRDGLDNDMDEQTDECDEGPVDWAGYGHAWTAAAVSEPGPIRPVRVGDVVFYPTDLQGLLMAAYSRPEGHTVGARCPHPDLRQDEQGRVLNPACADINAGTFHLLLGNLIGLHHRPIVADISATHEMWPVPVVEYDWTIAPLESSGDVARFAVETEMTYITHSNPSELPQDVGDHRRVATYTYILEVDSSGGIVGGEWTGDSVLDHPDFIVIPDHLEQSSLSYVDLERVRELVSASRAHIAQPAPFTGTTYRSESSDDRQVSQIEVPHGSALGIPWVTVEFDQIEAIDLRVELSHAGETRLVYFRDGDPGFLNGVGAPVFGFGEVEVGGTWTLRLGDTRPSGTGVLLNWSLEFH